MYKSPKWAYETHKENIFPATGELIEKIRRLLDPNKIMNPGQGRGED
jgi:FAD/FMN-containing dehydrogenase